MPQEHAQILAAAVERFARDSIHQAGPSAALLPVAVLMDSASKKSASSTVPEDSTQDLQARLHTQAQELSLREAELLQLRNRF